ncbi:flagellar biosynthesis protein [Chlamydia trachomatis]|uniref:FliH/SctL family protein n=1 Tax=Chlamydia trachomatis TaxID=813 RepID=UPI000C1E1503|nr:flagellar biosynthesis protein [Chlamydia trachomatis]ATW20427.1 flagellar biosynthesis protein [Chlamydia trachomatis]ATW21340.1 flagellar biosynthesis protein [Chlamydia trachomatis]
MEDYVASPHLRSLACLDNPQLPIETPLFEQEALSHELLALIQVFRKLSVHLLSEIEKLSQKLKPELLELAVLVCEKFLYRKLACTEELALLISAALQHHLATYAVSPIKIGLHPEDLSNLSKWLILHDVPLLKNIEFIADPLCKKASYKIELPSGILRQDIGEELSHLLSVLTP